MSSGRHARRDLSASTINVKLAAVRKLVGEGKLAGVLTAEESSQIEDVPNVRQNGVRLGNLLTKEQARELLAVPDRSALKGKRDFVILSLLVGCALRRKELAMLDIETIQLREGRWVLADLCGKERRIRTVAVPMWVKHGINAWITAAKIEDGRLLRRVSKSGKVQGDGLSDWAVWSVAKKLLASGVPPRDVASNLGVSVPTLYRWIPASSQARWWETHDVSNSTGVEKLLHHPSRGSIRYDIASFQANNNSSLKRVIYTPLS